MHSVSWILAVAVAGPAQASEVEPQATPPAIAGESAPPSAVWSQPVVVGDLDGDGLEDLVVVDETAGNDRVLRGLADGGLAEITSGSGLEAVDPARGLLLADLDADGLLDLVRLLEDGRLQLLRGVGGAAFEPWSVAPFDDPSTAPPAGSAERVAAAHVDDDELLDLVLERPDGSPAVLRRVRHAGFEPLPLPSAPPPLAMLPTGGPPGLAEGMNDLATGACLLASSAPVAGLLYPLSVFLNVDSSGRVGLGTTSPEARLHAAGGDVTVEGEVVTLQAGSLATNLAGTAATGRGGALALHDPGVGPSLQLWADAPDGNVQGALEVRELATGKAVRVLAEDRAGKVALELAGSPRATLDGANAPPGLQSQLELSNGARLPTVQMSGSWTDDTGRAAVHRPDGTPGVEMTTDLGGHVQLSQADGTVTVQLTGNDDLQSPELLLRTSEGTDIIEMDATSDDAGGGRIVLGLEGFGDRAFLEGARTDPFFGFSVGPAILMDQPDGTRGLEVSTARPDGDDDPVGTVSLFTDEGHRVLDLTNSVRAPLDKSGALVLRYPPSAMFSSMHAVEIGATRGLLNFSGSPGTPGFIAYGQTSRKPVVAATEWQSSEGGLFCFDGNGTQEAILVASGISLLGPGGGPTGLFWDSEAGTKAAVVPTESFGARHLYVREGAEIWLEEAGVASTRGGTARIELPALFLEVTTISDERPMRVFVTPHADATLDVRADGTGFDVRTTEGDVDFSWIVQATRRGAERVRLELAELEATPSEEGGR